MRKKVCLTGVKPTGMPHLGNYIGAIGPAIAMANSGEYDSYYFIADYHSLIGVHDGKILKNYIYEVAAVWLALGLDPNKVTLYKQSDIPEILELHWILSCFCVKGLMNRAHAYKAFVQHNSEEGRDEDHGVNMGLFTYPILMAADIIVLDADVVPVGADQLQHIEMARDMAQDFNHTYKTQLLRLPEGIVEEGKKLFPGLDGRKMSKSYNNHIPLFCSEKEMKKLINKITTDSSDPTTPKDPENSLIFDFYRAFASPKEVQELKSWYLRGIGWGEAKMELLKALNNKLQGPREIYQDLLGNPKKIDMILEEGKERVRSKTKDKLKEIKKIVGVL